MFVGTGSDTGKSFITTGFCRLLKKMGHAPAPFKAQNMSLNSFATFDGFEIGRAQAVQAVACGLSAHTDMNPILLKPSGQHQSQIVLHGKPLGNTTAKVYFDDDKKQLFKEAQKAFDRLRARYSPVVMEGAGSISELNLKHRDLTNMRMAAYADASVYLVADIDKGGVFATVYGTMALLEPWEKKLIKGVIINKFRGDAALFDKGRTMIESLIGVPVVGVLPYAKDIYIEEEDSMSLKSKPKTYTQGRVKVAVVQCPYLSNYTDFTVLERDDRVALYYSDDPVMIAEADIIILPGSKNTIADLQFMREQGIVQVLLNAFQKGKQIIGICGGYQMLGKTIADPHQVEGSIQKTIGLGIIPMDTVLKKGKQTQQVVFYFDTSKQPCKGYEIHCGDSTFRTPVDALLQVNGKPEGVQIKGCWGTYLHGFLDNALVVNALLAPFTQKTFDFDYERYKQDNYDRLATLIETHLDVDYILKTLKS